MKSILTLLIVFQLLVYHVSFGQCYKSSYYGGGGSYVPPATYKTYTYTTYTYTPSYTPSYKSYTPSYNYNSYNSYTPKSYNSYNYNSYSPKSYKSYNSKSTYTPSNNYNSYNSNSATYNTSGKTNTYQTTEYYTYTKLSFGSGVDGSGNVISPNTLFNIKPGGGIVKIVINNNGQPISTSQFIIDIYKQDAYGKYQFHETKYQNITSSWVWAAWDYTIYSAGKYKFSIYTSNSVFIKSGEIDVAVNNTGSTATNGGTSPGATSSTNNKTAAAAPAPAPSPGKSTYTDPYLYSKLIFALGVDTKGNALTESSTFSITPQGGVIQVIVKNTSPMYTPRMKVYINKKNTAGTYVYHDVKEYDISSKEYSSVYFPYTFYSSGDYQLVVYDKDSKYINTGYLSITNR